MSRQRICVPLAHTLESELKRIPGTRDIYTVGAPADQVTVELDPARMAAYGLDYPVFAAAWNRVIIAARLRQGLREMFDLSSSPDRFCRRPRRCLNWWSGR